MIKRKLQDKEIYYWTNETEAKQAIMFVHYAFGDHTCFDAQAEYFSKSYKVTVPDVIGHGESKYKKGLNEMSDFLNEILTMEQIEKVNLVGISLGAVIATDFANKYPEKIESLASISGFDINNFDAKQFSSPNSLMGKIMMMGVTSKQRFARDYKVYMCHDEVQQEKVYDLALKYEKKYMTGFLALGKSLNCKKYKNLVRNYPFLIGVGQYESEDIKAANRIWSESAANSVYHEFMGAGHLPNMDTPDLFNKEIENLIARTAEKK